MRKMNTAAIVAFIAASLFAGETLTPYQVEWITNNPCPGGGSPSLHFKDRNYHCMSAWNPCLNTDLQDAIWPTWPTYTTNNGTNQVLTPFGGEAVLVPNEPWRERVCVEDANGRSSLKPEWVVFDREMFEGDHPERLYEKATITDKIVNQIGRFPTFSLYNMHTGVLRTFILVSEIDVPNTNGYDRFFTEGVISGGDPNVNIKAGYGLLENGMSTGLPLSKASGANFGGWTSYVNSSKTTNFWYVIDQVLPYNAWDNPRGDALSYNDIVSNTTSSKTDLFLNYQVSAILTQEISLNGTMITEQRESLEPPPGMFSSNGYSGAVGQLGSLGIGYLKSDVGQQALSGAFGTGSGNTGLGIDLNQISTNLTGMNSGDIMGLIASQGSAAVAPIAISALSNVFFGGEDKRYTWEESRINLSGTIKTQDATNSAEIPLSRQNSTKIPLIFKGDDGVVRDDIEIGLYTFRNSPKVHLKRVDYSAYTPMAGMRYVKSAYHITIEDPTCDLVLNPTNGNSLVSLKMTPVLWNKSTNKWSTMGNHTDLKAPADFGSPFLWFDSDDRDYQSYENFAVGVDIAVQLAGTSPSGIIPVFSERIYAADLVWDDDPEQVDYVRASLIDDDIPDRVRLYPAMPSYASCDVDFGYTTQGVLARNLVKESSNMRTTSFEVHVVTGSEHYAGTDNPIYAEITTCEADGKEKVWEYLLNTPNYDEFEVKEDPEDDSKYIGASETYVFSEVGSIGAIKRVRFKNEMPIMNTGYPGWLLGKFSVTERDIRSGEELTSTGIIPANTWLAGIYNWTLVGAEQHPNISFDFPFVIYTYETPNASTLCSQVMAREIVSPSLNVKAYKSIGVGRQVGIAGFNFGRSTSGIQVYVGETEANVVRVVPEMITILVPNLEPGKYPIRVVHNGEAIQNPDVTLEVTGVPIVPPTDTRPSFLTFDENPSSWHSNETIVAPDTSVRVGDYGYSLSMEGDGYRVIRSPRFCATEWKTYGTSLAVDVYIPSNPGNPWWLGEVALFMDAPSAGMYNSWQGNVQITQFAPGQWHTVEIPLNVQALAALGGTGCDLEIGLVLNASSANESYRFDNLRFAGNELASAENPAVVNPPATGTGAGFACAGACVLAEQAGEKGSPMTLGSEGEKWYVLPEKPQGWQASEIAGRLLSINGISVGAGDVFPAAASDEKWYLKFSAGEHSWASWSWW